MVDLRHNTALAIFVLFFGGSMIDAIATQNWWRSAFWLVIALVFLAADRLGRRTRVSR
jgi:NADH:ubiquinone oxidoreductase subunit 6 (subunit J)